ncbi:RNA polymerase sigma factor [Urechidicola croceus]|uniref:RNA polymerase sigma factor n=1 Tax=Urechidicola croceus TaxID=1850246 RepID=A0A1D8PBB0_9FLAO|nr:RNA polymerase sigma factor [Urechidicola croceus]AOW21853.1 RNA polymerase [Urechidicola croceus]
MATNNDSYYIEQTLKGNTNSFSFLVEKYQNMVFALSLKMLKHREESEEVAQDTFIKAYKSLSKFQGDSKFSTWLYRITYNTCLDRIKKNVKYNSSVEINEITINEIKEVENIFEGIEREERSEIVKKCLDLLAEEERIIIHLFYFEEQNLKEISSITSLTESNIKVKLFRARKKLFSIFKNSVEPEIYKSYE